MQTSPATPTNLPQVISRRLHPLPERIFYAARPGLGALPSGALTILGFFVPQLLSLGFVLWAIWWPWPQTPTLLAFAVGGTALLALLVAGVAWLLLRHNPGFAVGVMRAPFIRLTVTDRRVLWTVPWMAQPLIEIGRERVLGGILGIVDAHGRGNAAMVLVAHDPAADIDGNIHFDRLPDAAAFVEALRVS